MRSRWLIGAVAVALLIQVSPAARAGLIGTGTNTVSATSFLGAPSAPLPPYPNTIGYVNSMGMTTDTPPPTIPVVFLEDALSLTTIAVGDTQITITNDAPSGTPFCPPGQTSCPNTFAGFGFTFSNGVDITGVSVDPASAADFMPNTTAPHMGLQLLSPTDILVDVTGDAPNMGDELIIDVKTGGATPPTVPEPWSLTLLASGLVGLLAIKQRAKRGSDATSY